ncbi:MAG: hypothetical protein ABIQ64_00780 [Candidatus Saccharimonadales bacterium]
MSRDSLSKRVRNAGLPLDKIIVIGSGVLEAYGIRAAQDIDLAVEPELFRKLEEMGWTPTMASWGEKYFVKGDCEAWAGWTEPDQDKPGYHDLLPDTVEIDGIRYMSLTYVKAWKQRKARSKDQQDVELISAYEEKL